MDKAGERLKTSGGPPPEVQKVNFSDLVTNIPVGVCKFLMDRKYSLVYCNQSFYTLFGYTPKQMKDEMNDELIRATYADERQKVSEALDNQLGSGASGFQIEHRVVRRDGTVIWVLVTGNFTVHGQDPAAHCVVVNITDRKAMEERLRIDEERFRLALAQTDSTIFDYDIATRVMIHADKPAEMYGLNYETPNVPESLVEEKIVHPDTVDAFLEMYGKIRSGAVTASCVVQTRMTNGQYVWRKITMTNIFDQDGKAVRAVGILEDIDEQTRREETLRERSQRDALTGLYHKGATEGRVRDLLRAKGKTGALLIIDIDCFKKINDHYGHMFGDLVLAESARRIAGLCRREDVIGRIGGDEFLVYLDGVPPGGAAERKAEEICAAFLKAFSYNGVSADVRCTVGVAICPDDGAAFEQLYQKADIALYEAKRSGRNQYCVFAQGMGGSMEWTPYSSTEIDAPFALVSQSLNGEAAE